MFRKIHSNRDPRDTLGSEIRKEFSRYFNGAGTLSKRLLEKRPGLTFIVMVLLLLGSITVSFLFFRPAEKPKIKSVAPKISPMHDGLSEILQAGEQLKRTMRLKNFVDSLSAKKTLSRQDSVALDSALDRLQSIQKTIK